MYFGSYYTCWALKEVCSFLPCRSFQIKRRFYRKLARLHQPPPSPLCLLLSAVCNDIECCLCVCVCRCVDADYFLVYLVTKSRFLFKLKSSLTPALNIIIKRAKKPSQELAPAEATHLHTHREDTHTHLHSYLQSSSIAIEIQSTNSSDTHTPISRFQFESVTKTESELELRF